MMDEQRRMLTKKLSRLLGYYTSEGWVGFRGEVPCVVSLCFSIEEQDVIEDDRNGFLVPTGDIHILGLRGGGVDRPSDAYNYARVLVRSPLIDLKFSESS